MSREWKVFTSEDRDKQFPNWNGTILIEQDKIDQYPEGVAVILNILGHSEALVTDYSQIGDFDPDEEALSLLDAKPGDVLWEIAERIEKQEEE